LLRRGAKQRAANKRGQSLRGHTSVTVKQPFRHRRFQVTEDQRWSRMSTRDQKKTVVVHDQKKQSCGHA
jgi:hypothetical protein